MSVHARHQWGVRNRSAHEEQYKTAQDRLYLHITNQLWSIKPTTISVRLFALVSVIYVVKSVAIKVLLVALMVVYY